MSEMGSSTSFEAFSSDFRYYPNVLQNSGAVSAPQQAEELLAPVCSRFTESFEALDLKAAKEMLDRLA